MRFISILAFALTVVGCAKELSCEEHDMVQASFCAFMGDEITKASDAIEANECVMEIYHNGNLVERQVNEAVSPGQFIFTASLIANRDYDILFWADKSGLYYNRSSLKAISFKSTNINDSPSSMDAFTARLLNQHYSGTESILTEVTLTRPFAQVSVNATNPVSGISYSAPLSYNLRSDSFGDNATFTVGNGQTSFLVFAPAQDYFIDVLINSTVHVNSVRIQRNYKTNINYNN